MTRVTGWDGALAVLTRSARPVLGPWLPRLDAGLGPLSSQATPTPEGEPDGVDGLSRRGPWRRLLASQWALADVEPLEFLRRATEHEFLFHALARGTPRASPRLVVWFDAGPDQLGAPRVAHLAIWLVLARRVLDRGGALRWGVLQDPGRGWSDSTDAGAGRALLAARTLVCPDPTHTDQWLDQLEGPAEERWVVGDASSAQSARRLSARHIQVTEGIGEDALFARVDGGPAVTLPLPSRAQLGGMLHDAFVRPAGSPPPTTDTVRVVPGPHARRPFTVQGRRLVSWSSPACRSWKRPRMHKRTEVPTDATPVAVGQARRRIISAYALNGRLQLTVPGDVQPVRSVPFPDGFALPEGGDIGFLHLLYVRPGTPQCALVTDGNQQLCSMNLHTGEARAEMSLADRPWRHDQHVVLHPEGATSPVCLRHSPHFAGSRTGILRDYSLVTLDLQAAVPSLPEHNRPVIDRIMPAWPDALLCCAANDCLIAPDLPHPHRPVRLDRPRDLEMIGAFHHAEDGWTLVGLADDRRTVALRGAVEADLRPAFATILTAWVSPQHCCVFWWDAAGQLGCVDLPTGRVRLRWAP
ncbi:MAG: hypothetical protein ACI8PZ_001233 [Myxococcota bacterium]|jgi:hypothetical protein